MKKLLPFLLMFMFGCRSNDSKNAGNSSNHPADTAGQQAMPQPPVSPDSAGARKNQERSSIDTVKRP